MSHFLPLLNLRGIQAKTNMFEGVNSALPMAGIATCKSQQSNFRKCLRTDMYSLAPATITAAIISKALTGWAIPMARSIARRLIPA